MTDQPKISPCPDCSGECYNKRIVHLGRKCVVACENCTYQSGNYEDQEKARNAHERICAAMRRETTAAGPWVPGPPPKDSCKGLYLGDAGGFGIKIIRKDGDDWATDDSFDFSDDEILRHAIINQPEGRDDQD